MKYTDPDGRYIVFKLEENDRYGLGSYYYGLGNVFMLTKIFSNFIPFGGFIVNLQKILTNIDPSANFDVLFDSDSDYSVITASNIVDGIDISGVANDSKIFNLGSKILCFLGVTAALLILIMTKN